MTTFSGPGAPGSLDTNKSYAERDALRILEGHLKIYKEASPDWRREFRHHEPTLYRKILKLHHSLKKDRLD